MDIMIKAKIKASDIGLKDDDYYTPDVFAKIEAEKEEFLKFLVEKADEERFNAINNSKIHTVGELIALMCYKGVNPNTEIHPAIFFEVAEVLERQAKELEECHQRASITYVEPKITFREIDSKEDW